MVGRSAHRTRCSRCRRSSRCPQPGRIDKFLFRSSASVTLTPTSWNFETDVFVDDMDEDLSDHDALAVNFQWEKALSLRLAEDYHMLWNHDYREK